MSIAELTHYPLVFRTRYSSTQRVVDKAFRAAGLRPEPAIVVDTREGMLEAVANQLGIGVDFLGSETALWCHAAGKTPKRPEKSMTYTSMTSHA